MRTVIALAGALLLLVFCSTALGQAEVTHAQTLTADESPYNIILIDLDGDTNLDLVTGDFNRDGKTDIARANAVSNDGDGELSLTKSEMAGKVPIASCQ